MSDEKMPTKARISRAFVGIYNVGETEKYSSKRIEKDTAILDNSGL